MVMKPRSLRSSSLALALILTTVSGCVSTPTSEEERPRARARIVEEGTPPGDSLAKVTDRAPPPEGLSSPPAENQRAAVSELNNRLSLMERELRELRGELEESHTTNKRLEEQVSTLQQVVVSPGIPGAAPGTAPSAAMAPAAHAVPVVTPREPMPTETMVMQQPMAVQQPVASQPVAVPPPAPMNPVSATPAPVSPLAAPPTITKGTPQERYDAAFVLLKSGQYDRALEGFNSFLSDLASDELADNAQYWVGEIHFVQRRYPDALVAFNDVLVKWPQSDKVPHSLLKIGYAFQELGDVDNARKSLERLIKDFPDSPAVAMAKQRLKTLPGGAPPPASTAPAGR